MLKELLDRLLDVGSRAEKAELIDASQTGDPRLRLLRVGHEIRELEVRPLLRQHQVRTLQDLVAAATTSEATNPVIYHDEGCVILLLDDSDRRDEVTFNLTMTQPHQALRYLAQLSTGTEAYPAKNLWRLFNTTFADCEIPQSVINNLKRLKWRTGQQTTQEFSQGRESIGRDVEAELQSDVEFPESITPSIRLYEDLGEDEEWPVRCVFEVDPLEERIHFGPYPGEELARAAQLHQGSIRQRLERQLTDVPIYYGSP